MQSPEHAGLALLTLLQLSSEPPGGAQYTRTTHAEISHAPAKGDTLFPSPLTREECYSNFSQLDH